PDGNGRGRHEGRGQERREGRDHHHHVDGRRPRRAPAEDGRGDALDARGDRALTTPKGSRKEITMPTTMRAAVFQGKGKIGLREAPSPEPGVAEALIRVTLTTICGTDVHILKGEYPVKQGLTVGHEPVGVVEALGPGVAGYAPGDRVIAGAITPCGQCR